VTRKEGCDYCQCAFAGCARCGGGTGVCDIWDWLDMNRLLRTSTAASLLFLKENGFSSGACDTMGTKYICETVAVGTSVVVDGVGCTLCDASVGTHAAGRDLLQESCCGRARTRVDAVAGFLTTY